MSLLSSSRWLRGLLLALLGLLLLVALGLGVTVWMVRASLPPLDGEAAFASLRSTTTLERDAWGQVTVRGREASDLAFGLGFAHGQDRFFQMDLMRRASAGELAELFGPAALGLDRRARRHGFRAVARMALESLPGVHRARLEAYAAGVNAGLGSLRRPPFEYLLLRTSPRPWVASDALLVSLSMYRDLQDEDNRIEAARDILERSLPPERVAFLWPRTNPFEAPVRAEPVAPAPPIPPRHATPGPPPAEAPAEESPERESDSRGSNSFAVGGALGAHGAAILANDMHLGLSLPNTWYRACLVREAVGDSLRLVGATLPGTPALVVGSNGHIAWGFTNSYGDWLDFLDLEIDPDRPSQYRGPEGWAAFGERVERIEVKGGATDTLRVRTSSWGPVVGESPDGRPRALRWVAHAPGGLNLGLVELADCRDLESALDVAARSGMPHQNLLLVDDRGRLAWTIIGRVPRRSGFDGSVPIRGGDEAADWHGWLAPGEVPRVVLGREGRLWTANARVTDLAGQSLLGDGGYALGARAAQIREGLLARDRFDERAMLDIQLDDRAIFLQRWRDLLLEVLERRPVDHPLGPDLAALLQGWEGRASTSSFGYRLVRAWHDRVHRAVGTPLVAECRRIEPKFAFGWIPREEASIWPLVSQRPVEWTPAGYADWDGFLSAQIDSVLFGWGDTVAVRERTWGERNTVRLRHPLSRAVPALSRWLDLPARALPGDRYMPRVQGPGFGASERMVVSPGREEHGLFHMPGGQSGHPLSPHYRDQQRAWEEGRATPLLPGPTVHRWTFRPAQGVEVSR